MAVIDSVRCPADGAAGRTARRGRSTHRRGAARPLTALFTALLAVATVAGCAKRPIDPDAAPSGRAAGDSAAAPASAAVVAPAPPVADRQAPAGFVALSDVDSTILQDIRYATAHNFVGRPVNGYQEAVCVLTRPAAEALHRAQQAAQAKGYSLKVYDCYRPQRAVDDFVGWSHRPDDVVTQGEFYPRVDKATLIDKGYIGSPSGHSRGSTMDLTLVANPPRPQRAYVPGEPLAPCYAPQAQRFPDNSVDMGTGYDCFDTLAHTLDPRVTGPAHDNRLLLKDLMTAAGFTNYADEWWHYSLNGEPFPKTYHDFPVNRAALTG